jgi:hypothetical protein
VRGFAAELVAQVLKYTNPQWTPFNIILQDYYYYSFFFYWAPVASAPGSTAACRLIGQARLWKFPLVPPGTPTPTTTGEASSREGGIMGEKCPSKFSGK